MINIKPQYLFRPTIQPQEKYNINNQSFDTLDDEDYKFETEKPKSNKIRNTLLGSLVALASISIPTIEYLDKPQVADINYNITNRNNDKIEVICNPELIAKGGKNDSLVETREFLNLLNFDRMKSFPKSTQSGIEMVASAHYHPVMISDKNAKEKIIKQVEEIQKMVDTCIDNYIKNPDKTYEQKILEYQAKYISPVEIIDQVDFSEISKYQRNLSVLKAQLRNSVDRIERKDYYSNEKLQTAVNKAQKFVDELVEQCKKYGKIAGNTDYNNNLSKQELIDLLDHKSIDGLDKWTKRKIINKATDTYTPISFDNIKDENKIKEKNKQIGEEVQKAQYILDCEATIYKYNNLNQ